MKYIHPVFMLFLLGALWYVKSLGCKALAINPKSPEASSYDGLVEKHGKWSVILVVLVFIGMLGGILSMVYFLDTTEVFLKSYGHGIVGAFVFVLLVTNIFVGRAHKKQIQEKMRKRLMRFHKGVYYCTAFAVMITIATGLVVLFKGPAG